MDTSSKIADVNGQCSPLSISRAGNVLYVRVRISTTGSRSKMASVITFNEFVDENCKIEARERTKFDIGPRNWTFGRSRF